MTYELAKQLKDAGFWPDIHGGVDQRWAEGRIPTLSELIEACGERFGELIRNSEVMYLAIETKAFKGRAKHRIFANGTTPEEAVAKLWLELNKK